MDVIEHQIIKLTQNIQPYTIKWQYKSVFQAKKSSRICCNFRMKGEHP